MFVPSNTSSLKRNNKAFSLVELLIAMAIIAVLITIGAYAINIVQRNARDTKRRKIIENVRMAFIETWISSGMVPQCIGTSARSTAFMGGRHHISIYSGPPISTGCSGTGVNVVYVKDFTVTGWVGTNQGSGHCPPFTTKETAAKDITMCYDNTSKQLRVKLEGSTSGFNTTVE